uniref:DNA topoisomerase 2 n=1 Tax=Dunaliella tertiolecta TaxID=3047 RepID=A0A7S3VQX9_DUNTE
MDVDSFADQNVSGHAPGKAPKAKAPKAPLADRTNAPSKQRAIEDIYQKKSQLEHILLRPDTYIGSTEKQQQQLWVHDGDRMVLQSIGYVPGLYKIFDEILVNAADNKVRDPSMDTVRVTIDEVNSCITIWNNGHGVPVEIHKEENVYVPELIFGHLLTSSNYDDDEKKITGGRNGYGAKLANIFSKEFVIETCDGQRQRQYRQVFRRNMTEKEAPKITACKASEDWTSVTFKPDLGKFGMQTLEADTVSLMRKRVYDLAGVLGRTCKVYLNNQRLNIKSFPEYVDLYLGPKDKGPARFYERISDRWELCISATDGQFNQVSFVNSICTVKGGTHVNYIVDQVTKALTEKINKKNKHANVKPFMVKNHLWVFLNCNIENPAFDSQTKENLTLRSSSFGSKCELPQPFIDKVAKCGVVDSILQFATFKNSRELKKSDGAKKSRITGIPKLDDANDAGGRASNQCTLILTEGDSAKTLAISGLSVIGRDHYGVFPLRGKLLNVRDANMTQISANTEIQNLKQILGLQHGKVYEDAKSLRYGHLMIMTDQDHDGSHIKGLIMNFLHTFYPSLLKLPGFLMEFITPIVKATKKKQRMVFYTMPEYEAWKESLGGNTAGWSIKYYKGLGTSTREEAREYFAALNQHRKRFVWGGPQDDMSIEMAFSKKKIDERKNWLSSFCPGTYLDNSGNTIGYSDFINKELILFSRADLERSIPSMVDGLKPGQRKIMFASFKRNLSKDIKVAQLAGYVSEHSAYHHGEQSLTSTIVGLAQDFVGSNNINMLVPSGQFGTRLQGGKDAASARYIYTRLAPLARHLFNEADDSLLNYLNEEGQSIEPVWYMPIIPTVLVNGAEGIGTGWSTTIPNFNPHDIVNNIKRLMNGEEQEPMHPWYRGFHGKIEQVPSKGASRSYMCSGTVTKIGDNCLEVTELPVRKWTQDYKEFLESMVKPEDKNEGPSLIDYKEYHTDVSVRFQLELTPEKMAEWEAAGIESKLKLTSKFATSNMMLFDKDGLIKHYATPEQVLEEFYELRLHYYELRRQALLKAAEAELLRISNRVRFIKAVISGSLRVNNRKRAEVEADLEAQQFDRLPSKAKAAKAAVAEEQNEEDGESSRAAHASYDYLLSMAIYSLTWEKVQALEEEADMQAGAVAFLAGTTGKAMWQTDLDRFLEEFERWEAAEVRSAQHLVKQQKGVPQQGAKAKAKPATKGRGKKKQQSSSEEEEDSESESMFDESEEEPSYVKPKPPARKPAAPKPAGPKPAEIARAPPAPEPRPPAAAPKPPQAEAPPAEPLSLAARLAGRFQKLDMGGPSQGLTDDSKAPRKAATAAAKKMEAEDLNMLEDDDTEGEAKEPALPARQPPAGSLAARKAAAAALRASQPTAAAPAAAPKRKPGPAKAAAPAKGAGARSGRKKKVVYSDTEEEEEDVMMSPSDSSDAGLSERRPGPSKEVYEMEAFSPAVAPKGKKKKVGPSPAAMKLAAKTAASGAAAGAKRGHAGASAPDSQQSTGEGSTRPCRARRAAAPVSYVEIKDSSEEVDSDDSGSVFGSDDASD